MGGHQFSCEHTGVNMLSSALCLLLFFGWAEAFQVQKYINPCGVIYSSVRLDTHGVRKVFHHMKPQIEDIIHIMKTSHHKRMDEYDYKKTWIPDESNIIITHNVLNSAKQLPEIYRSLQYFSYALDVVLEDLNSHSSELCFFGFDTLPTVISKHQQLVCAVDAAMGQLDVEVPTIRTIDLPQDWANLSDKSCVHKFFRFSEVHTKYRRFLHALFDLTHV